MQMMRARYDTVTGLETNTPSRYSELINSIGEVAKVARQYLYNERDTDKRRQRKFRRVKDELNCTFVDEAIWLYDNTCKMASEAINYWTLANKRHCS